MEFDLVVGNRIEKEVPKNIYRVDVEFMHGDADGETHVTFDFNGSNPNEREAEWEPTLDEVLSYLVAFFSLEWNAGCDFCREGKVKERTLLKFGIDEDARERVEEAGMWEHDITCEEYQARPANAKVTYFDEYGVEHDVDFFEKGTKNKPKMTRG